MWLNLRGANIQEHRHLMDSTVSYDKTYVLELTSPRNSAGFLLVHWKLVKLNPSNPKIVKLCTTKNYENQQTRKIAMSEIRDATLKPL